MSLDLENLDERTREFMLAEVESDCGTDRLTLSTRFTPEGAAVYPDLLRQAIRQGDDASLTAALEAGPFFAEWEEGHRGDKVFPRRVRKDAARLFSEGEFNRFYVRGLCLRASTDGISHVEVYRARPSVEPRPDSEAKIGETFSVAALLADLRDNVGVDTALGLPQVNSGLSVRLPKS